MRTVIEINRQIQAKEYEITELSLQLQALQTKIDAYRHMIDNLEEERIAAKDEELKAYIDNWLSENFGIKNQNEARNGIFIVFDKEANFVKTVTCGIGAEFHYAGPAKDKNTMEYWLQKNKLYAHRASSFCDRNYDWYRKSFKEQLQDLGWKFYCNGKLSKTHG